MRISLLAILATLLVGNPAMSAEEQESPSAQDLLKHPEVAGALSIIDAWIEGTRHYEQIPGISVGFVRDQDLIWTNGYGSSNLASGRPADDDTLYSICSISKSQAAINVVRAV